MAEPLAFVMADIARLLRQGFEMRIAASGLALTPAGARVLHALAASGALSQSALARRLAISRMSLGETLATLDAAGLVMRTPAEGDGRLRLVSLSQAGRAVLPRIEAIGAQVRHAARQGIDNEAWAAFVRSAHRVRENLSAQPRPGASARMPEPDA
ncbi:MAG: MarR family winged helix-turn-helix transcriptional regulator [Pararhodobacter sp.]